MRLKLRVAALVLFLAAAGIWIGTGAHRGWSKTYVEVIATEPVTGLEMRTREDRFVAGLDFLGAAGLAALTLAGISFLIRKPNPS
jgi:hypothetical protein